jgi:gluconolactonase
LADGFGGEQGPAEGPLWWKEGRYLLFSDIHNNRRMKYEPGKGLSLFQEPTDRDNGLTRDLKGRLIACEHDSRRVTRQELDGSTTVIANSFQGRQLNRPNDVVVKSDSCTYFTDPWSSPSGRPRAMGSDLFRCVSRHPGSRDHKPADRRLYSAERSRFFTR